MKQDRQLGYIKKEVYDLLNLLDTEMDCQHCNEYSTDQEAYESLAETVNHTRGVLRDVYNELRTPKGFENGS